MANTVLFAVDVLILLAIWQWFYKPAVLAKHRSDVELLECDVEDAVRTLQMSARDREVVAATRRLLAQCVARFDQAKFWRLIIMESHLRKHREAATQLERDIDRRFKCDDPKIQAVVDHARFQAFLAVMGYAVNTSLFGMCGRVLVTPYLLARKMPGLIGSVTRQLQADFWRNLSLRSAYAVCAAIFAVGTPLKTAYVMKLVSADHLEGMVFSDHQ